MDTRKIKVYVYLGKYSVSLMMSQLLAFTCREVEFLRWRFISLPLEYSHISGPIVIL